MSLNIVIFGLSITSSWGNGHATTYRALAKALARRGHTVAFLERDKPWYREHRDLAAPDYCKVNLYADLKDIPVRYGGLVRSADLVMLGSYVPDGIAIADWLTRHAQGVTAFYDIDTPVTLSKLAAGDSEYMSAHLLPRFDLYLSFTGGPIIDEIEQRYGSPRARVLYCSADPEIYAPQPRLKRWALGYLGTYSADRQQKLDELLLKPAMQLSDQNFVVAGASYLDRQRWPDNVLHIAHLPPDQHPGFYCAQRFALNVTRADMVERGFSPSVRLFEAAACGVPVISDRWPGLDQLFTPEREILLARDARDVLTIIGEMPEHRRLTIAANARARLLRDHTADHRARELEGFYQEAAEARRTPMRASRLQHASP